MVSPLMFAAAFVVTAFTASISEARETVRFDGYRPGTIVVRTSERRLYLVVDDGMALRYPVGVGKAGKAWAGTAFVDGKHRNPASGRAPRQAQSSRRHSRRLAE
jgi:lipoprotein-anchoring transpeptidase ErfK/SrfK